MSQAFPPVEPLYIHTLPPLAKLLALTRELFDKAVEWRLVLRLCPRGAKCGDHATRKLLPIADQRMVRRIGQTPADNLTGWRIALAQNRLREGRPIKVLAE